MSILFTVNIRASARHNIYLHKGHIKWFNDLPISVSIFINIVIRNKVLYIQKGRRKLFA